MGRAKINAQKLTTSKQDAKRSSLFNGCGESSLSVRCSNNEWNDSCGCSVGGCIGTSVFEGGSFNNGVGRCHQCSTLYHQSSVNYTSYSLQSSYADIHTSRYVSIGGSLVAANGFDPSFLFPPLSDISADGCIKTVTSPTVAGQMGSLSKRKAVSARSNSRKRKVVVQKNAPRRDKRISKQPLLKREPSSSVPNVYAVPSAYIDLGDYSQRCEHCDALFWIGERLKSVAQSRRPQYNGCCAAGKVGIAESHQSPEYISHLFQDKAFMENIRAYNQIHCMRLIHAYPYMWVVLEPNQLLSRGY